MSRHTPWIRSAGLTPLSGSSPSRVAGYRGSFDSLYALPRRSLARPLWTWLSTIPKSRPPILSKIRKVRRPHPAFMFQAFMGFPLPIQAGGLPYTSGALHMQVPFPHTLPRLPHTTSKLQKSRHWFQRDQLPAPQICASNRFTQIPRDGGAWASGYGIASRCDDGDDSGARTCMSLSGLKAGQITRFKRACMARLGRAVMAHLKVGYGTAHGL